MKSQAWNSTHVAREERVERSCTWLELQIAHSMCDWDEMIMQLAIAYGVGPRNTFAIHHWEVTEIALARRSSTRNARCTWRCGWRTTLTLGVWVKLLVSYSTCNWDETIKNTAIAYAIGPRNTLTVYHREVNEIAIARRSSTRNARCATTERMRVRCRLWFKCKIKQLLTLEGNEMNHALLKFEDN